MRQSTGGIAHEIFGLNQLYRRNIPRGLEIQEEQAIPLDIGRIRFGLAVLFVGSFRFESGQLA
jgi:hypothetical protein